MVNSHAPTTAKPTAKQMWKQTAHLSSLGGAWAGIVFTALLCIAACTPSLPNPDPTAIATSPSLTPPLPSPTPSPLPLPTPTATPVPSLTIRIQWPEQVSALKPVPLLVELIPSPHFPPDTPITATIRAVVAGPGGEPRWQFDLQPVGEDTHSHLYSAPTPLQLPLIPSTDDWLVVVMPHTQWPVTGKRSIRFRPLPMVFYDLTGLLPDGVQIRVPVDFIEKTYQGDQYAGGRVWQYKHGELSLWWAPGPAEPLQYNIAIVMLETTHNPEMPPQITHSEETTWEGQPAYYFQEEWSYNAAAPGDAGGPAEAFVIQGPDDWLYVLRLRQVGRDPVLPILSLVRDTFSFSAVVTIP